MRSSWHSWFWNAVLYLCMLLFCTICSLAVVDALVKGWPAAALAWGIGAAFTGVVAVRAFLVGVWASDRGIEVRGPFSTTTIPWADVVDIGPRVSVQGPAGLLGARSAVVIRRRKDKPDKTVVLISTYGFSTRARELEKGVVYGLDRRWKRWKASTKGVERRLSPGPEGRSPRIALVAAAIAAAFLVFWCTEIAVNFDPSLT